MAIPFGDGSRYKERFIYTKDYSLVPASQYMGGAKSTNSSSTVEYEYTTVENNEPVDATGTSTFHSSYYSTNSGIDGLSTSSVASTSRRIGEQGFTSMKKATSGIPNNKSMTSSYRFVDHHTSNIPITNENDEGDDSDEDDEGRNTSMSSSSFKKQYNTFGSLNNLQSQTKDKTILSDGTTSSNVTHHFKGITFQGAKVFTTSTFEEGQSAGAASTAFSKVTRSGGESGTTTATLELATRTVIEVIMYSLSRDSDSYTSLGQTSYESKGGNKVTYSTKTTKNFQTGSTFFDPPFVPAKSNDVDSDDTVIEESDGVGISVTPIETIEVGVSENFIEKSDVASTGTIDDVVFFTSTTTTERIKVTDYYDLPTSIYSTLEDVFTSTTTTERTNQYVERTRSQIMYSKGDETNDYKTSPYLYNVYTYSTFHYVGGWGATANTEDADEMQYTTLETSPDMTEFATNNQTKSFSVYAPVQVVLSDTSDSDRITLTITTIDINGVGEAYTTTAFTDSNINYAVGALPSNTRYSDNNFFDSTIRSFSTSIKQDGSITFQTTETNGSINATEEKLKFLVIKDDSVTFQFTRSANRDDYTSLQTYYDGDTISTFENVGIADVDLGGAESTIPSTTAVFVGSVEPTKMDGTDKITPQAKFTINFIKELSVGTYLRSVLPTIHCHTFQSLATQNIPYISETDSVATKRKNLLPPEISYTEQYLTTTKKTVPNGNNFTVHTTESRSDISFFMPSGQRFSKQGFFFYINEINGSVFDSLSNSITYDDTEGTMEKIQTFTNTYSSTTNTYNDTTDNFEFTTTFTLTSLFRTTFKLNTPTSVEEIITNYNLTINETFINESGEIETFFASQYTDQLYFGGQNHTDKEGLIVFPCTNKFTLVDCEDSNNTTEISTDLTKSFRLNSTSSTLGLHKKYFFSTRTEFILGSTNDVVGDFAYTEYDRNDTYTFTRPF